MIKTKKFVLAAGLAASIATLGLTGCHTEDRSAGRYMDDHIVAHRIESTLNHDPVYKYPDVKVDVFDGVAQLSGFVDTHIQIARAAEHASRVEGVREVINNITLKPQFKLVPTGSQNGRLYENGTNNWNEGAPAPTQAPAPIVRPEGQNATPNYNQNIPGNTGGNQ